MATYSSILAWRIPKTEKPGGLQPMGSRRAGHDSTHTHNVIQAHGRNSDKEENQSHMLKSSVYPRSQQMISTCKENAWLFSCNMYKGTGVKQDELNIMVINKGEGIAD